MRRKQPSYLNTKSEVGREKFCKVINGKHQILSNLFADSDTDISTEFQKMTDTWDTIIRESFDEIKPKKNRKPGIDKTVRDLMKEEKHIRETVKLNPERGRLIFQVRKKIHDAIARNRAQDIKRKINELKESKNPHVEIFRIRRERQVKNDLGFPLKDKKGH